MSIRPVAQTNLAQATMEGAGVHLHRAFGFGDPKRMDPFLLFDDFRGDRPADYQRGLIVGRWKECASYPKPSVQKVKVADVRKYLPADTPVVTPEVHNRVMREIIVPTVKGMAADGILYTGFLYAGLMIDDQGNIKVLEFNCRFGDPETQPVMMRLKSDFVTLIEAALDGRLDQVSADWDSRVALGNKHPQVGCFLRRGIGVYLFESAIF